ncbi:MAG: STAS domain-containing protein [Planctomycetes bacterium]|nr:STAS domain-containing protein [Planctomycetota bacterium]
MFEASSAIQWEKRGDITFIRFKVDKVTDPLYANQAGKELNTLAERVGGKVILNLSNVKFMSSIGITLLVTLNRNLRARRGHLKVCEVFPLLMGIFSSTGLQSVLDVYPTEAEAIASFRKPPGAPGGAGSP